MSRVKDIPAPDNYSVQKGIIDASCIKKKKNSSLIIVWLTFDRGQALAQIHLKRNRFTCSETGPIRVRSCRFPWACCTCICTLSRPRPSDAIRRTLLCSCIDTHNSPASIYDGYCSGVASRYTHIWNHGRKRIWDTRYISTKVCDASCGSRDITLFLKKQKIWTHFGFHLLHPL